MEAMNKMSDFKKGDTVELKSGGLNMTVQELGDFPNESGLTIKDAALCVWFDPDENCHEKVFACAALRKVKFK